MEKMTIVGRKKLKFKANNGDVIEGIQLFVTHPDEHTEGEFGEKLFIGINKKFYNACSMYPIGSKIGVTFNRYGKPEDITVVNEK